MASGQKPKGLNRSCFLLIVIAGMERFAFKGVASNLVTYLTDVVMMSNSAAAKTVNNWCGFTSMLPLLVASLADSWDRYSTILSSSFLYVVDKVDITRLYKPLEQIKFRTMMSYRAQKMSRNQIRRVCSSNGGILGFAVAASQVSQSCPISKTHLAGHSDLPFPQSQ